MYGQDEPFVAVVFVLLFLILLVCWIAEELF
jgi:hypothetical protein